MFLCLNVAALRSLTNEASVHLVVLTESRLLVLISAEPGGTQEDRKAPRNSGQL